MMNLGHISPLDGGVLLKVPYNNVAAAVAAVAARLNHPIESRADTAKDAAIIDTITLLVRDFVLG